MTTPLGRRRCAVVAHERHGAYVVLTVGDPEGPRPRPGQFYMLMAGEPWGGGEDERPFLPRAFSVLRAREGDLDFMLEDVGPGTHRLCSLRPGDDLWLLGPLGKGFVTDAGGPSRPALLVGGGVGTAPLGILQDELMRSSGEVRALLGFRDARHAAGAALLRDPRVATDDGSVGHHGRVTELLAEELDFGASGGRLNQVYACGPPAMLEAVRALCAEREVPAQLALESGMACGFGACFGCVVETRTGYVRLCVDGPVLDGADLEAVHAH